MLADSPRPDEFDDTWPEPVQAEWVTLALTLTKADGTPVRAEFLRPREWVERHGIVAGASLPIAISELEIEGDAFVTSITACPLVAEGPGRVVTGRFVTRDAGNLVQITLENGTEIRATDVHPIWSMDREEWIPAGELVPGELVDTLAGSVAVETVERLHSGLDVYNIEVHGEHVFRVTADGVLVHNACPISVLGITLDPADGYRSFAQFKRAFGAAGDGKAWHHIVEQTINSGRFAPEILHNPANLLNVPHGAGSLHANRP